MLPDKDKKDIDDSSDNSKDLLDAKKLDYEAHIADLHSQLTKAMSENNSLKIKVILLNEKNAELYEDLERIEKRYALDVDARSFVSNVNLINQFGKIFNFVYLSRKHLHSADLQEYEAAMSTLYSISDEVMKNLNIEYICPNADDDVDQDMHQILSSEKDSDTSAIKIKSTVECGYKFNSKVVKQALVIVKQPI